MSKKEILEYITAFIVIISAVIGANTYLAKASDVDLLSMRLEQKIVSDAAMQTEARKWQILDRNNARDCPDIKNDKDKEECRSLEQKIKEMDKRNQILIEKTLPSK